MCNYDYLRGESSMVEINFEFLRDTSVKLVYSLCFGQSTYVNVVVVDEKSSESMATWYDRIYSLACSCTHMS